MNVIVTNKQKTIIDNANIDAIKDFNGLFNIDDLISKVKNYFFSKLILDATSIVNFSSKDVLEKLASSIGADRLIILLPTDLEPPQEFINLLISLKIYNFSRKINDIVRFINIPNTYDNIVGITKGDQPDYYVDNSIKANDPQDLNIGNSTMPYTTSNNTLFNPVISDDSIARDNFQNNDVNNFTLQSGQEYANNNLVMNQNSFPQNNVNSFENNSFNHTNSNIYQPTNNFGSSLNLNNSQPLPSNVNDGIINQFSPVGYNNVSNESDSGYNNFSNNYYAGDGFNNQFNNNINNTNNIIRDGNSEFYNDYKQESSSFVLGIKNITLHAGSTTLIYLLMKVAREKLKLRVNAVEVNKDDFKYYNDSDMISATTESLKNVIASSNANLILVDLNDYYGNFDLFNDVIYLVEPSVIRLNKLMMENRFVFKENSKHTLMLNMSLLNNNEMNALSKEAGVNFVMNIPPLNDRIFNDVLLKLLSLYNLNEKK